MVTAPPTATQTGEQEFLDLICDDADLLAAEFDAIIASAWPGPPRHAPPRDTTGGSSGSGRHSRRSDRAAARAPEPGRPGSEAWSRQRSPPAATTTTDDNDH